MAKVKSFESGRFYRWAGPPVKQRGWSDHMEVVLDGKPVLCTAASGRLAIFDRVKTPNGGNPACDWEVGLEHWRSVITEQELVKEYKSSRRRVT